MKDLYTENYDIDKEKMKIGEETKIKIYHAHGLEESILLKCTYYPKWSTDWMQLLSKWQWHFLTEIDIQF